MKIPSRKAVIQNIREQGGKIAAVLPYHYPRALLRAHNIFPVEVWGPPHVDDMAGVQHFPEYTCKIAQKATHFLSGPGAGAVDCILIPHTCDSLQGMASVMADFIRPEKP
ncbi:MAG: 2-hydroxyacyl-CoA dehydratase family protein, partial [Desulfobacterales bacterium]|nr:2-hydroxyacyl-CoA dehydratase family protein [Desulfobacterales bacterium]